MVLGEHHGNSTAAQCSAQLPEYLCTYMASGTPDWSLTDSVELVDVVTGLSPRQKTRVRACWTDEILYMRFECEDDNIVSPYTERDDPLYEADVVECFLDPIGDGRAYYEFNVSPHNVVFDAYITIQPGEPKGFHPEWNAEHLCTSVFYVNAPERQVIYELAIPFEDLKVKTPEVDSCCRVNWFRIDQDMFGARSYDAWSPTGAVNFHMPERFGALRFTK